MHIFAHLKLFLINIVLAIFRSSNNKIEWIQDISHYSIRREQNDKQGFSSIRE